jgi:hypothetical protein
MKGENTVSTILMQIWGGRGAGGPPNGLALWQIGRITASQPHVPYHYEYRHLTDIRFLVPPRQRIRVGERGTDRRLAPAMMGAHLSAP